MVEIKKWSNLKNMCDSFIVVYFSGLRRSQVVGTES